MTADAHLAVVRGRCAPAGREWLDAAIARLGSPLDRAAFQAAFAGAARRVGVVPMDGADADALGVAGRPLADVARTALLLRALEALPSDEHAAFVDEVYRRGDGAEQAAVLRALPLLPGPERFLATAVEACRTNSLPVFAAVACANPYPARYFPELHFNQMVLKVVFVELPLRAVVGLDGRITPDLRRMAADYARERRAAGRPVPPDVGLLTGSPA